MPNKFDCSTSKSLGFLATNAKNEEYDVYEKNKKRILEAKQTKVQGSEVELYSKYVVAVVKGQKIEFLKTIPIQLNTIPVQESESRLVQKSLEKRNQLGEAFGTKKRKQQIRKEEQNQIQVSTLGDVKEMTAMIEKTVSVQDMDDLKMKDRTIPPCNLKAGTPSQVYNVDDICPPHLLNLIDIKPLWKARTLKDAFESVKKLNMGQFVKDLLEDCLKQKADKSRIVFLAYLLRFYSLRPAQINRDNCAAEFMNGCSLMIMEHLQSEFLESQGQGEDKKFIQSAQNKDKLLAYALCLCLILNQYQFDSKQIASDLHVNASTVVRVAKELGCRSGPKKEAHKILLQLPLQFPKKSR